MWNELPNYDEVSFTLKRRASVSAEIRLLELQIQILEAEITLEHPRNTAIRILGTDGNKDHMRGLRVQLVQKRGELDELDAEIKLLDYRKDIYKSLAYRERA